MIDCAKMIGITPAVLTRSGMCVLCPPYIFRPTIRFAYCTGILRCAWVIRTTTRGDEHHDGGHDDEDDQVERPWSDGAERVDDLVREAGHDPDEDDERDAVADAPLGDLLARAT